VDYGMVAIRIFKALGKKPNINIVSSLRMGSTELARITAAFVDIIRDHASIRLHSFYEEYPINSVMMVERYSSILGHEREGTSAIPKNHTEMAKVSDSEDNGFRRIVAVLKRWLKDMQCGQFRQPE
jgi:hypothetical protein